MFFENHARKIEFSAIKVFVGNKTHEKEPKTLAITRVFGQIVAEREGFEPSVGCPTQHFQCCTLRPLGHLSVFGNRNIVIYQDNKVKLNKIARRICPTLFEKRAVMSVLLSNIV